MTTTLEPTEHVHSPAIGHDPHAGHDPFLQHHFESHRHQFDAAKLGMWLFLITEVLFFSGLFCLYVVYRVNHPEIFEAGHEFLDKKLGAINTVVLLFSSLTMAWAVRSAQLGHRKMLIWCLSITLACAGLFLVIKYFEYSAKISHGVLWASQFDEKAAAHYLELHHAADGPQDRAAWKAIDRPDDHSQDHIEQELAEGGDAANTLPPAAIQDDVGKPTEHAAHESHDPNLPRHLGLFFSIYFCLTGLHGIHILAGIGVISWILWRSIRGDFTPTYFGPVDFVGLYWHIVDLIWIYLFPLLYLIE